MRTLPRDAARASRPAVDDVLVQVGDELGRHAELPAELARERHAERPRASARHVDLPRGEERPGVVRQVLVGEPGEQLARRRARHVQRRPSARDVGDRGVGRQPGTEQHLRVALCERRREHQEPIVAEPGHGRVHLDAPAGVAEQGVDDATDGHVQLRRRQPLQARERAGSLHEELRVGRQVVQRHALACRPHLVAHGREPRRLRRRSNRPRIRRRPARTSWRVPIRPPARTRRPPHGRLRTTAPDEPLGRSSAASGASASRTGRRATRPCARAATRAGSPTARYAQRRPRPGPSWGDRPRSTRRRPSRHPGRR